MKARCTVLRRAARAVDAAEGGPPAPVDGGFDGWLIFSAVICVSFRRLHVGSCWRIRAYGASRAQSRGRNTRGVERLSGLRRPPNYGRVEFEGVLVERGAVDLRKCTIWSSM